MSTIDYDFSLFRSFKELYFGVIYDSYDTYCAYYKTKLCISTSKGKECPDKEDCYYAHSEEELKKVDCVNYVVNKCPFKECKYSHSKELRKLPFLLSRRINKLIELTNTIVYESDRKKRKLNNLYDDVDDYKKEIDRKESTIKRLQREISDYKNDIKEQKRDLQYKDEELNNENKRLNNAYQEQTNTIIQNVINDLTVKHVQETNKLKSDYANQMNMIQTLLNEIVLKHTNEINNANQTVKNITSKCMHLQSTLNQKLIEIEELKRKQC